MKISILLPYKEDYSSKYAGAVSIHVSNLYKKRYNFIKFCIEVLNYVSKNIQKTKQVKKIITQII